MKKILSVFVLLAVMAGAATAQNTKVYLERGGAKQVIVSGGELEVRTGGLIDMQAGSTLTVNAAATINIADAPTFSGISVTYGVGAATGVFSGALSAATLNTGQGAYELYKMDQNVDTAATVTHAGASLTYGLSAATGSFSGALDADGQVTMGAAGTVSTITTGGAASFHASVSAPAITGTTSVTGAKVVVSGGPLQLYSRTQAQIEAFTPSAVGEVYYCNDCTATSVCVSSAAAVMSWVSVVNPATACD